MKLILLFLFFAILLQSFVTSVPLTIPIIIFSAVFIRTNIVFFLAFFSGFFLDLLTLNLLGVSSLFFVILVFIIYLYQRKFEIDNAIFVSFISFVASLIYLFLMGSNYAVLSSFMIFLLAGISFLVYKLTTNKKTYSYR